MNEQEKLTDFIVSEKKMSTNYSTFASECVNIPLRDTFLGMLKTSHETQTQLFQAAQQKGWYTVEQAQQDKVQQAYTKYDNQKPQ